MFDGAEAAIYAAAEHATCLEDATQFSRAFAIELATSGNVVIVPIGSFATCAKGVAGNGAVCQLNGCRVCRYITAFARYCTVGKFQLAGDFLVKKADIKIGCAFDNRLVAGVIVDIGIAAVFQAVFAGRLQDSIGFRS